MEEEQDIITDVLNRVYIAEDNRLKCTYCKGKIEKGNKYYREAKQGWRSSHTINLCRKCAGIMFINFAFDDDELMLIKKEMILKEL
jgi:hypothetical protein